MLILLHKPHAQQKASKHGTLTVDRVATNVENLEYSGISLNMENSGNSHGILCNLREKRNTKYFQFVINRC